jgi:hypothetical protein
MRKSYKIWERKPEDLVVDKWIILRRLLQELGGVIQWWIP